MRQKNRAATIHDVAREAGVSVSTVSRVLNRKDDVSLETFEKVREVIDRLAYTSSLAARGMRSHRTNVIGLIMPDIASAYCVEIMQGVNRAITPSDYDLFVFTKGDISKYGISDQQRLSVMLINANFTDGLIVVAPVKTGFCEGLPVVVIDPNDEMSECPSIIATNREGARAAVDYLTGLGHRRIAHITGRRELISANQRLQGYLDGLAAAGIEPDENLILTSDFTIGMGYECAQALLSLPCPPTAIFSANDMTAIGIYQAAQERGMCIPEDLSVVGFDNIRESNFMDPPLTTVDQSVVDMGTLATEILIRVLEGQDSQTRLHLIPTRLVIRDSCAAIEGG